MTTDVHNIAPFKVLRHAQLALSVVLLLAPWVETQALGLGEVSVFSAINQPLNAEIELLNLQGLEESELIVSLGSTADYNLAGVRYNFFHAELEFEADLSNPARPHIRVTTDRTVTEPYLNFVIQARWPSGRLLREYTILLDLPVFSGEQTNSRASAPVVSTVQTAPPRQQQSQPVNVTPSPAASAPPTPSGSYRVQFGDTLWEIAERVANETGITHAQVMLALRDLNPEAFFEGNLNRIMSGSLLRIPTPGQVTVRDPVAARAQVASELGLGDSTPLQSTSATVANASSNDGGQFRLATAESESSATSQGSGVSNTGLAQVQAENAVLKEELDAVVIENDDLRTRLAQLEEQIAVLERLVEVENSGLAQAQNLSEPQQTPAPVVTSPSAAQPSFMASLMGWLPWIGMALVGLLVAAYMVMKRRGASETDLDISDEMIDEIDEPIGEIDEINDADMEAVEDSEDDFDAGATVVLGASPEPSELANDDSDIDNDDFGLPEEAEDSVVAIDDEDDDTDFDDLDAFFSDIDDKGNASEDDDFDDALIQDDEPSDAEAAALDETESVDLTDDEAVDKIESALDEDMDMDFASEEVELNEEVSELSESGDENAMEFDLGDVDLETEEPESESVGEISEPSESGDENAMEFDLGDADLETDETESSAEPLAEVVESDDGNAMDFDMGGDDMDSEEPMPVEDVVESDTSDDENALDFDTDVEEEDESPLLDMDSDPEESLLADTEAEAEIEESEVAEPLLDVEDDSLTEVEDTDDLDDSIFADLGDDDLDDLLGPGGDEVDLDGAFSDGEDLADLSDDAESSDDTSLPELESDDIDDEEDLSSLTAMLDNGALDSEGLDDIEIDESAEPDDDLDFDLDLDSDADEGDELGIENEPAVDATEDTESEVEVECATKLELAEAYIDMGDESGAQTLLKEVRNDGNESQQAKAQELLDKIS